ncbi:LysR family transcriptional regulator [Fictibacillus macauensis ZFHKF-1]|uniref:LysR family transcriptional regulator n=1 Tax=Fictibacillus macauensis ZFHKF-1 TaxID=1196324 RepID=I8AKV2_9BACL|nr:LysR family transcriptional regulator [Fictibacillus macauensis]EIT86224.1 LysR family transcriptional regulator [Fictibacillus macauensis ZFHKF-1]
MKSELAIFVAVVEKAHFSEAAKLLHLTQPAVSRSIKQLEQKMNAKLLYRTTKEVALTKAGKIVYDHAKEILGLYERMEVRVNDTMNQPAGPLKIAASYTFGEYVLPHIVARVRSRYEDIVPSITIGNTREVVTLVAEQRMDLGIIEGNVADDTVVKETFASDSLVVVASRQHPLVRKDGITMSDLVQETWIVREEGSGTREATEHMFEEHAFSPASSMEFGSTQSIKEAVEAGLGIAFLSSWAIRKELSLGTLAVLPLDSFPIERYFTLVTRATDDWTKAMQVFIECLLAHPFCNRSKD